MNMEQAKIENLFLSVGAMKAGTTWVYDKLQHHPQIHFSEEKEVYYFSHVHGVSASLKKDNLKRRAKHSLMQAARQLKADKITLAQYRKTLDWYLHYATDEVNDDWYVSLFDSETRLDTKTYCSDFSNLTCLLDDDGWKHIRNLTNKLRVIYILRDPVARLWSHYKFHLQFTGHKDQHNPDQDIKLFQKTISKPWFIRNSFYSENIQKLTKNLNDEEFKVFYLEDISQRPFDFFSQVHQFLGIDDFDYSFLDIKARKNTSIQKDIPEEWVALINQALVQESKQLKSMGLWHNDWTEIQG